MMGLHLVLLGGLRSALRSHTNLALEDLALRQQLAAFARSNCRPRIRATDRLLWIALRRLWSRWSDVLVFVKPETVIRWHGAGFRRYWTWLSRYRHRGRPSMDGELRALIRRMATENATWGAPRIHGELLMLGFDVSERTVSRYMPRRPLRPDAVQGWLIFLRNHRDAIAAMDSFVVPTVTFRVLYVWFALEHGRRRIHHFGITDHQRRMGRSATPRGVPIRHGSPPSGLRSGFDTLGVRRLDTEILQDPAVEDRLEEPLAERRRRTLGGQCPTGSARPRDRVQRASSLRTPPRLRRLLPR